MSETKLTAMETPKWPYGAMAQPSDIIASIRRRESSSGMYDVLCLRVGTDTLEIFPARPDVIMRLGLALVEMAESMQRVGHDADCVCIECCPTRKGR